MWHIFKDYFKSRNKIFHSAYFSIHFKIKFLLIKDFPYIGMCISGFNFLFFEILILIFKSNCVLLHYFMSFSSSFIVHYNAT